jgi:hypothetical protein
VTSPQLRGRPVEVTSVGVRQGPWNAAAEDAAMTVTRYANDAICQTHEAWTVPYARNWLEVHGSAGSLLATNVMRADPGGSVWLHDAAGAREIVFAHHRDAYEPTLEAFAAAVAGAAQCHCPRNDPSRRKVTVRRTSLPAERHCPRNEGASRSRTGVTPNPLCGCKCSAVQRKWWQWSLTRANLSGALTPHPPQVAPGQP